MSDNVHGTFVSHKVSRIRWKPEDLAESEHFVSGSLDETVNNVTLWHYPVKQSDSEIYPVQQCAVLQKGDVTEIKFLLKDKVIASLSSGSVNLLECTYNSLTPVTSWNNLHYYKSGELCSCSGLACFEEDVATIGEDGRLNLLTITVKKPVRVIEKADSCPVRCVCFLKHNEVLTGNLRGQMKIWDLRLFDDVPLSTFMLSGDQISTTCITVHPTQKHLLLAGAEDGTVSVWDLRKSTHPINVINAHKSTVSEIVFHPEQPEHLFTCSGSGELWHWNTSRNIKDFPRDENTWLSSDAGKHRMEIFSLMAPICKPINSLDINRDRLICGCDNEAIYIIKNLPLLFGNKPNTSIVTADNQATIFLSVKAKSYLSKKQKKPKV